MYDRIAFSFLQVADIDRAVAFYAELLGLPKTMDVGGGNMRWVEFDLPGGGCLAISDVVKPARKGGTVVFEVLDLDAEVGRLKQAGISFFGDIIQSPVCRMVPFADPDGNELMLHQLHDQTRLKPAAYGLVGKLTATDGNGAALAGILREGCQNMPGCTDYVVAHDAENPDVLWVTERWVSQAHHEASLQLPTVQQAIAKGRPLIAGMERVATTT